MATRKFKLNNTRVTKDNIKYKMKSPTEASVASNTTNTRSFTSAVTYNAYKTIDDTANKMRGKINDFLSDLLGTEIDEFCGFNDKNERYMRRLMLLNVSEHDITMDSLGTDAALLGDGSKITNMAQSPTYATDINYTDNFARQIDGDEKAGKTSTRKSIADNNGNYVNHGQLYYATQNLYYDDNGTGTFEADKIDFNGNQNSILYKTKVLFKTAKINTIISRFHTDGGSGSKNGNENVGSIGDAKSKFGKSHGRNLLLKSAENGKDNGYSINGYNNPYCRVWTHHFQYDKLYKRIRPFYEWDENGNYKGVRTLKDFHKWKSFGHDIPSNVTNSISDKDKKKKWSWKVDTEDLWNRSVLQSNGFVNITPKYQGGGALNVHTKDCMFSIENLAWKGYDPYSFEQALSWEQRGPNGGRIMWFPPYGIEFNETTNVNWVEHQFIGRGENVYTYANTTRTGTLSFLLLVDHPSVIDYVQWHGGTKEGGETVKDSDLLRFFAGCDSGNSEDDNSLLSYVKPTPLTDEYVQSPIEETISVDVPKPQEPEKTTNTETLALSFYVFYPNNYSGTYDHMGNNVEAIAYLLAGDGAQKKNGDTKSETDDEPLTMDDLELPDNFKYGYESLKNSNNVTGDKSTNYIFGTKPIWQNQKNRSAYIANNKKWYYRIDGEYKIPSTNSEYYRNTYDQTLLRDGNYEDTTNFKLNSNVDKVREVMNEVEDDEGKIELYSLAEVAFSLENLISSSTAVNIREKCGLSLERCKKIHSIFNSDDEDNGNGNKKTKYKIKSITGIGYSNSHDSNNAKSTTSNKTVSQERNDLLAKQRCETVFDWLTKRYSDIFSGVDTSSEVQSSKSEMKITTKDVSNVEAKKWRSAKITITLEREVTTTVSTSDSGETTKYVGYTEKQDADGKTYYEDEDGNKWTLSADGKQFTRTSINGYYAQSRSVYQTGKYYQDIWKEIDSGTYQKYAEDYPNAVKVDKNKNNIAKYYLNLTAINSRNGVNSNGNHAANTLTQQTNNLRYDQEYHFFKKLQDTDPLIWDSLMKKIQYFDPAFHSGSPESFNARLTFLQQCTRQGNTIGASDSLGKSANNLAFGQAPYCILRLGDFYHQMICIDNISIDYNELQWDLNTEGIGVQPLLAKVSLSFKFIGGGSMEGAVRRLQNAMTFNYYANTGLYDNRADRPKYVANEITGISTLDTDNSYAYTTQMAKPDNKK